MVKQGPVRQQSLNHMHFFTEAEIHVSRIVDDTSIRSWISFQDEINAIDLESDLEYIFAYNLMSKME